MQHWRKKRTDHIQIIADQDVDIQPFQKSMSKKAQQIEACIWSKDSPFSLSFSAGVHPSGRITKLHIQTELEASEEDCIRSLLRRHRFAKTEITKIEKINVRMKKVIPRGKVPRKDKTDYLSNMNMIGTHSSNSTKEHALFRFATSGLNKGTFDLEQHRIQSDGSNCTFSATGTIRVFDEETILGTIHNDKIYCIMNLRVDEDTIHIDKDVNCPSITEANSQCMDTPSYSITFQKNN